MKYLIIIPFVFMTVHSFGQIDKRNLPLKLQLVAPVENKTENSTSGPSIEFKSIFDKDDSYLKRFSISKNNDTSKSILDTSTDFKNPGEDVKKRLNQQMKQDVAIDPKFKQNQFLGEFKTDTKYIKIVCRDHQYPDGDRVRVLVNDATVINSILLESSSREYYLDLNEGFNKIDFLALNQGESGPNTAAFTVYDENGVMITSNEWNLLTGVKASIVVFKQPKKETTSE
ncbi:MAG: hypothetical protein MUF43_04510 [Flavobacterium sp.]|nr:hypothetical protein [Flavobacterium sp.]